MDEEREMMSRLLVFDLFIELLHRELTLRRTQVAVRVRPISQKELTKDRVAIIAKPIDDKVRIIAQALIEGSTPSNITDDPGARSSGRLDRRHPPKRQTQGKSLFI